MPHPRKQPVPVHEMEETRYLGHHTICEKLREIYRATEDQEIRLNCRIGMAMAKAMLEKLHEYKNKYEPGSRNVITKGGEGNEA